ncbi:hypothetical protein PCI56_11975 [Plesiomonas shigelloides subsp. oncorhynchi]|nr:hypothetical protein [Plesiomonas shigelloides]
MTPRAALRGLTVTILATLLSTGVAQATPSNAAAVIPTDTPPAKQAPRIPQLTNPHFPTSALYSRKARWCTARCRY